jgi:putative lipoprotein
VHAPVSPPARRSPWLRRFVASCLVASALTATVREARAEDAWWGQDKALHFGVSAGISGVTYGIAATQYEARYPPMIWGAGVALTLGAGKELYDLTGRGDPSWKDFTWDVIGTATGLLVAWSIDLLVRGVSARHPLIASPSAPAP